MLENNEPNINEHNPSEIPPVSVPARAAQDDRFKLSKREIGLIILTVIALALAGFYTWKLSERKQKESQSINSFAECVAAGNPVMESYPEQCAANGRTFTNPNNQPIENPVNHDDSQSFNTPTDDSEKVSESEEIKFSSVSSSLQKLVVDTYVEKAPECTKNGGLLPDINKDLIINKYQDDKYSIFTFGCKDGSAVALAVNTDYGWKVVHTTQNAFDCKVVDTYKVPKTITSDCYDYDKQEGRENTY